MELKNLLEKIKKKITPEEKILVKINSFRDQINNEIKKNNIKAVCLLGGSVGKGTFLRGEFDVDLFVKFDYSLKSEDISKLLGNILKKYNPELLHGSRDYYRVTMDGIVYEIVPVLSIKSPEEAVNVMDMSPLHVEWLLSKISSHQRDEIRLLKKFCRANNIYGAESYIRGFSGHVIDILIVHYGSFLNVLKASQKWKPKVIIDVEKHYSSASEVLFRMNKSKTEGPMVVVDPVLKTRNAASSLSYEKFYKFKDVSTKFLENPSEEYFVERKITLDYLKEQYKNNLIVVRANSIKAREDVAGVKLLKSYNLIKSELEKDYVIKDSGWWWDKKKEAFIWFWLKDLRTEKEKTIIGPPLEFTPHVERFKKKYGNTYIRGGRIIARVERKITFAPQLVNYYLKKLKEKRLISSGEIIFVE